MDRGDARTGALESRSSGLVYRDRPDEDRRVIQAKLTEEGRRLIA